MRVSETRPAALNAPEQSALMIHASVACGFPSPSQDYQTSEIDLNEHLMPNRAATYIVRAYGHSMTGAGIADGDELIVDRSITPTDGSIVIVALDGELTVKRLRTGPDGVFLAAENPDYPPIPVPELSDFHVWGVVTRCLHHVQ